LDDRTSIAVPETKAQSPLGLAVPPERHLLAVTPLNGRRWESFKANRRGYASFWLFLVLFFVSLVSEFIANDKPLYIDYDGKSYFPVFVTYPETAFGGDFETAADYRDPFLQKLIADKGGTMIWPPIRYSYNTHNLDLPTPAPSKPTWLLNEQECGGRTQAPFQLP
jgi:microcin C transport system permease protein